MLKIQKYTMIVALFSTSFLSEASEMRLTHDAYVYPYTSSYQPQHTYHPPMRGELGASTIVSPSRGGHSVLYTDIQQAKAAIANFVQQVSDPSFLEQSIAGQIARINRLSHMELEANRVRLTNELSKLRQSAAEAQGTVDQMLSQMGLSFLTTTLTPEEERRAHPSFVASFYNNKSLLQSLTLSIATGEQLLQHNEARLRSIELELSKAEEGFRRQIPDSRLYERCSTEVIELKNKIKQAEKVKPLQDELAGVTKAIEDIDHFYVQFLGKTEKLYQLKNRRLALEGQIKEIFDELGCTADKLQDELNGWRNELDKHKEIDAYKERCTADYKKIQAMYQQLVKDGAINKDESLFEMVAGESFIAHELSAQHITPLTPAAREWLKLHGIDVQAFESLQGDTTQKLLMNRLCEIINRHGRLIHIERDKSVDAYTTLLAQDIETAKQAIKKGTPYQALAWTGFSEVVDQAARIAIAGTKGIMHGLKYSAKFYYDPNVGPESAVNQLLDVCGFCLNVCRGELRTAAKLQSMCTHFAELPRDQQIEQAAALFTNLLNPDPGLTAFADLDKTLGSLHDVMQREAEALQRLSKLDTVSTVNGVPVPERLKDDIKKLISVGRITSDEGIKRWVEYLEAPLLFPLNQALIEFGRELSRAATAQSPSRAVPISFSKVMLDVERKEHAALSEVGGLSAVAKPTMSDALHPFAQTAQLIPASETQKAQIKQLHDHYQRVTPHAQSKFVPYREQRIKVLADAPSTEVTSRTYQLLPVSEQWVKEKGILHTDAWKTCKGSAINQEIHSELVTLVNEGGMLHYAHKNERVHVVTDSLAKFVILAKEANERNAIPEACRLADACWSLLDYGCAIGEGVIEGASRVGHMVTHPVETVMGTGQLVHNLAYLLCEYEAIGDVTCSQGAKVAETILDAHGRKINDLEKALNHALSTTSGRDFIKAGTAMAAEMWLTGKITAATKPLFDMAKNRLAKATRAVWDGAKEEVILAGEMEIRLAAETSDHIAVMQAVKANHAVQEAQRVARTSAASSVHKEPLAVLKDGYYEVNGFKFTEYYYNRLWDSGRGAPSLTAKAILENAKSITPDKDKIGFFKYLSDGWEMIYNPNTREIWHLQPIKEVI